MTAANCLREQMAGQPEDPKLRAAYEGLLDLLDPSRLLARKQREQAEAARPAPAAVKAERRRLERRAADRRQINVGPPAPVSERRKGDRRTVKDRRRT